MSAIGKVQVDFVANIGQFSKGVKDATASTTSFATSIGRLAGRGFSAMQGTLSKITSTVLNLKTVMAGAALAFGAIKIAGSFNDAAETVDKLGKAAKRLGLSVADLSGLRLAAGEAGVEFDTLAKMVGKAQKSVGQILNKGGSLMQVGDVSIMLREVTGEARPIARLLPEIAAALEAAGDEARQLDLAASIFGKAGGDEFMTLLKDGGDFMKNLADQTDRARRLGVLFTETQVKNLTAYNDAVGRIGEAWLGFRVMILNEIAPMMGELADRTAETMGRFTQFSVNLIAVVREAVSGEQRGKAIDLLITAANTILNGVWTHVSTRVQEFFVRLGSFAQIVLNNIVQGLGDTVLRAAESMVGVAASIIKPALEAIGKALKAVGEFAYDAGAAVVETWEEAGKATEAFAAEMARQRGRANSRFDWAIDSIEKFGKELRGVSDAAPGVVRNLESISAAATAMSIRLVEFGTQLRDTIQGFAAGAANAFADFAVEGKASFADLAKSWGKMLISMAVQFWAFKPIFDAIGNWAGGQFGAPASGTPSSAPDGNAAGSQYTGVGPTFGDASGAAYVRGVQFFARGGVVGRPTLFGAAGGRIGLMGEAGPEAIMPLTRVGSDLGVKAIGGGTVVNIIDQRQGGEPVQAKRSRGPDGRELIEVIVRDTVNRMLGDGSFDRAMGSNFGVGRRPTAR